MYWVHLYQHQFLHQGCTSEAKFPNSLCLHCKQVPECLGQTLVQIKVNQQLSALLACRGSAHGTGVQPAVKLKQVGRSKSGPQHHLFDFMDPLYWGLHGCSCRCSHHFHTTLHNTHLQVSIYPLGQWTLGRNVPAQT